MRTMKLKQYRKSKGLSLDDVREITGISVSTLWRIENKVGYKTSLQDALIIVNYFPQISMEDLNNGKIPDYPPVQKLHDAAAC
jgi:DNA-binding XRE family transcriptional regulator